MAEALLEANKSPSAEEEWTVARGEKNGQPLLLRYRNERPTGVEPAAFPFLLSATWAYEPNEFGLPETDEMERMGKFEDALTSALEGSRTAHLMVVMTGGGERDWLWYTCEEEAAMEQVNRALKGHKPYPVQFAVQKDRAWRAYSQFVAGNSARPAGVLGLIQWLTAKVAEALG